MSAKPPFSCRARRRSSAPVSFSAPPGWKRAALISILESLHFFVAACANPGGDSCRLLSRSASGATTPRARLHHQHILVLLLDLLVLVLPLLVPPRRERDASIPSCYSCVFGRRLFAEFLIAFHSIIPKQFFRRL